MKNIRIKLLAVILGGVCLYIYICFAGIFFVFLLDSGYLQFEGRTIGALNLPPKLRTIIYLFMMNFKDFILQVTLGILCLYWFVLKIKKDFFINTVFLLFGALIGDFLISYFSFNNISTIFWYSPFSDNPIISYFFNIAQWSVVFLVSILIAQKIRIQQLKAVGGCPT